MTVTEVRSAISDLRARTEARVEPAATPSSCADAQALLVRTCDEVVETLAAVEASMATYRSEAIPTGPGGVVSIDAATIGAALAKSCIGPRVAVYHLANEYTDHALAYTGALEARNPDTAAKALRDAQSAIRQMADLARVPR
jgi:hypothetical protein